MRKANVTEEQISRILEMQREGHPYKVIAAELQITDKTVSAVCLRHGIRRRRTSEEDAPRTLTCPKCKRDGFPADYLFCPYCAADIRTERDKLIDLLERTQALFTPPYSGERESKAHYAISRALTYLEDHDE